MKFNDVDLSGSDYNLKVTGFDLNPLLPRRVDYLDIPNRFGGVVSSSWGERRILTTSVAVYGEDGDEFRLRLGRIAQVLRVDSPKYLEVPNYFMDRRWKAIPSGSEGAVYREGRFVHFSIRWLLPEGVAWGLEESVEDASFSAIDEVEITIDPGGTLYTSPIVVVTKDDEEPDHPIITLENVQYGEAVSWSGYLIGGGQIRFDTATHTIHRRHYPTDSWSLDMKGATGAMKFPYLYNGVDNTLKVTFAGSPSLNGSMQVTYTERYL